MKNKNLYLFYILILLLNTLVYSRKFEYRLEESSIISWNGIYLLDARYIGTGNSFFLSDALSGSLNPSLINDNKKNSLGFNYSFVSYDSFQYNGINEGVKKFSSPLYENIFVPSSFAGKFSFKNLSVNLGWYISEILRFPSFEFKKEYASGQFDFYKGIFSGLKNNLFFSILFKVNRNMRIGLKLDYVFGFRDITTEVHSAYIYTINGNTELIDFYSKDYLINNISQIIPTIGANYKINKLSEFAFYISYPYKGKVKRTITSSFINTNQNIKILREDSLTDNYYSPLKINVGYKKIFNFLKINEKYKKKLIIAFEAQYLFWSDYKYIFFDEEMDRDMTNSYLFGFGAEYGKYSEKKDVFYRAGFKIDKQPVNIVNTVFKMFSLGYGIRIGKFSFDIGSSYWLGSSNGINRNNFILSLSVNYFLSKGG